MSAAVLYKERFITLILWSVINFRWQNTKDASGLILAAVTPPFNALVSIPASTHIEGSNEAW